MNIYELDGRPALDTAKLQELVEARVAAKRAEDSVAQRRKEIDTEIATLLWSARKEGSSTASHKFEAGPKVSVTYGVNVKVDAEGVQRDYASLPSTVQLAFRWKPELNAKVAEALPHDQALILAKYVTKTPGSPSVKVEA